MKKNRTRRSALEYLFNPQSIAIAGVSKHEAGFSAGRIFMDVLKESGFKGNIYAVNPTGEGISGIKAYKNIKDIPGNIDYAISAIPARYTPEFISDCGRKGVKAAHLFTAGFGEVEDTEGSRLEKVIVSQARETGVRIIGPNCMGLYCPETGLSFGLGFPKKSGSFGFLAQSGGNSTYCVWEATERDIHFSKVISYGNAVDLNESDFLEYLAFDPQTEIIGAYIEGIRDGPRFKKVLVEAAERKPVIVYKAGITKTGKRAAASHTGAVAGSDKIWAGFLRQAGVIQVKSIEEIVDCVVTFKRLSRINGKRVALVGMGGGHSVRAADECTSAGLEVPFFPQEVRSGFTRLFTNEAGWSFRNPIDIVPVTGPAMLVDALRLIAGSNVIDIIILHVGFDIWPIIDKKLATRTYIEGILELRRATDIPIAVVLHSAVTGEARELAAYLHHRLNQAGLPVYPSFRRAAAAINNFVEYNRSSYEAPYQARALQAEQRTNS